MDHANLLDADAMTRLAQMEVIATRIVEGFVSGKHRSPYHGSSVEFAEHRAYSPGDEVRLIDWRVFARRDRYYIKRFEEETNVQALLVVDTSGSMAFGQSTMPKLRYAQMAAACLARLMLHQRDAVGLAVLDTQIRSYIPPRSRPGKSIPPATKATWNSSWSAVRICESEKVRKRGTASCGFAISHQRAPLATVQCQSGSMGTAYFSSTKNTTLTSTNTGTSTTTL